MDVIERLHACNLSIAEIGERAGLDWRVVDALVARTWPGEACALPPEVAEALGRVLPKRRKQTQGYAATDKPLVGTRKALPVVIVGSMPARVVAHLARVDQASTAELAAALPGGRARNAVCAMGSVLSRMLRDTRLLAREPGEPPYRYRLTPLGWRVADALARWRG